jgi:hypothetical protein
VVAPCDLQGQECDLQGCAGQGTGGSAGTDAGAQQQHKCVEAQPDPGRSVPCMWHSTCTPVAFDALLGDSVAPACL